MFILIFGSHHTDFNLADSFRQIPENATYSTYTYLLALHGPGMSTSKLQHVYCHDCKTHSKVFLYESTGVSLSDVDTAENGKKRLPANAKKPALVAKEKTSNALREKVKSVVRKRNEQIQSQMSDEVHVTQKQTTLKDLCPEDKQRVANLIKELARLGEEKENAMSQLAQQKAIYEDQTKALAKEKEKMKSDREAVELQLKECQLLLDKYQQFLSEQQKKRPVAYDNKEDLTKPGMHVKEIKIGIPKGTKQMLDTPSQRLLEEPGKSVIDAIGCIQIPDRKSDVSYFSETQVASLATSNPLRSGDSQCDQFLTEKFSFPRPAAVASGDNSLDLIVREQAREPTLKQPFFSDSLSPKKFPKTGPLNRPNLSSTRCSEYKTDDRFPLEMQFSSNNDHNAPLPIVTNSHFLDQVTSSETVVKYPAPFVANSKISELTDRDALANRIAYNEFDKWPDLSNSQNNRRFEEAVEPFLLSSDPDDCLPQSVKSGFEVSVNSIPIAGESERQGKVGRLSRSHKESKEELLAQKKALLDEQRRLNEALLHQEAFFKKQEHELKLLQAAQHSSRFNMRLEVESPDIHEMKRDEEFRFASRHENSYHSQKPVRLVNADLPVLWDQRFPRVVSADTSPMKLQSPRTLSTEANHQTDRPSIPPSIMSSSAEESKPSRSTIKSSKMPTEIQESIDGRKFQRVLQTRQTQPVLLSGGSSDSHRVVPNSCSVFRSSQAHSDDDDSDSSFEDSKIIEDLFFVK